MASNCAWCGDPGDEYGSHGICAFHAQQVRAQHQQRKQERLCRNLSSLQDDEMNGLSECQEVPSVEFL